VFAAGVASAASQGDGPHIFPMRSTSNTAPSNGTGATFPCTSTNLVNNGGPVLQNANTYTILWGKDQSSLPADFATALPFFFGGIQGSSGYADIVDQYLPGVLTTSFAGSVIVDARKPPAKMPFTKASTKKIVAEVCRYIKKNQLPLDPIDSTTDSGSVYFVFSTNFPSDDTTFCGWHNFGKCKGKEIAVSYIPNSTATAFGQAGCELPFQLGSNGDTLGTQSILNIASHEYAEAVTDPELDAWWDSNFDGCEIGDKCAWQFASTVNFANSTHWQLQMEWDNSHTTCEQ
jgi:hypothetical protein